MKKIIHISDLHFGTQNNYLAEILLNDIKNYRPDLVVISGDLTQRAKSSQYEEAVDFLSQVNCQYIAVPGNHDISLWNIFRRFFKPLKRFQAHISDEEFPDYVDEKMAVVGINSARSLTIMGGRISDKQIAYLKKYFCDVPETKFKAIVVHHNLIPSENIRSHKIVGRSRKLISELKDCKIDMVFSGHIHQYYSGDVQRYYKDSDSIILVQAGTALSSRIRKDSNSYNHIEIDNELYKIKLMEYKGTEFLQEKLQIYRRKNEIKNK